MESTKIKITLIITGVLLGFLILIVALQGKNTKQSINKDELVKLMKDKDTILIDVRTKEEFDENHIEKAINIPLNQIKYFDYPRNTNVIVYCKSGVRSSQAADELIKLGYLNVYDFGSIDNW